MPTQPPRGWERSRCRVHSVGKCTHKGFGGPSSLRGEKGTPGRKTRPLGGGSLGTWIRKALPGLEGSVKTTPGLSQLSTRDKPSQKRSLNTGKYLLTVQKTRHPNQGVGRAGFPGPGSWGVDGRCFLLVLPKPALWKYTSMWATSSYGDPQVLPDLPLLRLHLAFISSFKGPLCTRSHLGATRFSP